MHSPFDKRVFEKEARSLAAAGHEVTHLTPDDGPDRVVDGIEIRTYRKPRGIVERLTGLPAMYRRARRLDADVYHCNELDSFMVGVALRRFARKKCVLDVHEFFARDFADNHCPAPLRALVRRSLDLFVRRLSRQADAVILANEALRPEYAHLPQGRVLAVENFASTASLSGLPASHDGHPFTIIHLGLFGALRGARQILGALRMTRNPIHLVCVGSFIDSTEDEFRRLIANYQLEDRVHLVPWKPQAEAIALLQSADAGLILFQPGRYAHVHALPHKLFDYMGAGLAVIAPDICERIGKIVGDARCGVSVDSTSPHKIAEALDDLCERPDAVRTYGANGRQAVFERYNWEREAKTLLSLYASFGPPAAKRAAALNC